MRLLSSRSSRALFLSLLLTACSDSDAAPTGPKATPVDAAVGSAADGSTSDAKVSEPKPEDPGVKTEVKLSSTDQAELAKLRTVLDGASSLTAESLLAKRAVTFTSSLGYDPRAAKNLDLIQASYLRLSDAELAKLSAQGFVITKRRQFPNMIEGYSAIYAADLPVYISLDAILDAVHISYDAILKSLEQTLLSADLKTTLDGARGRLKDAGLSEEVAGDLDLYFSLALSLLQGERVKTVFPATQAALYDLYNAATDAQGILPVQLFGSERNVDFSQFKPRGHYTDSQELARYFRATMWLGRTDFRLIETMPNGSTVFRRRQLDAAVAIASLIQGEARAAHDRIDRAIGAFVGEHDFMQVGEVDKLVADLGGSAAVATKTDDEIAGTIVSKGYGAQRIASQVIFLDNSSRDTLPLSRSFALLGQRYVVDSHVFSNVVFDRVKPLAGKERALPDPLDVAYAALGNAAALPHLVSGLQTYGYAPELEQTRLLVDAHGSEYWGSNLYNLWLSALRAVSQEGAQNPTAAGLPAVTGTEAWSRRLLNTQLGSWAQLRHDTILYAKQSYSSGLACEFPDGYVDPYPAAYAQLALFAKKGQELAALFDANKSASVRLYFEELEQVMSLLQKMAEQQKTGVPFDAAQMAFLNDAVKTEHVGCTADAVKYTGWLRRLLYSANYGDMDPTVADVHTDPGGMRPPKVLHVAAGLPRQMVVTRESCSGPRAYVGVAFAYHEIVTGLERMTDIEWAPKASTAEDVTFMKPILP